MQFRVPENLARYLLSPWPLSPEGEQKRYFETTHRVYSPEKTYERISPLREKAGITRLADITYLDCLEIPTYNAVRPKVDRYQDNITVYNGKGLTKIQAKVSALMEAFERHAGERHGRPAFLSKLSDLTGPVISPERLILPEGVAYVPEKPLEWVCGTHLFSGGTVFVPAAATFFPYEAPEGAQNFTGFHNTNGLASGNTLGEAVAQALAEVIERDSSSIAEILGRAETIDLDSFHSPLIRSLIEKFSKAQINLVVKDITSELGIPSFFAVADDPHTENPVLLCEGIGTHPDSEIAVIRAITEVAQSRCTFIAGAREDLEEEEYKRKKDYGSLKNQMAYWYDPGPWAKNFESIKKKSGESLLEDIDTLLGALSRNDFCDAVAVNLTHPDVGIPVVRVIVPGLELGSIHRNRLGSRAKKAILLKKHGESDLKSQHLKPHGSRLF